MSDEVFEMLLEKCGPVLRGCRQHGTPNTAVAGSAEPVPPLKGILKKPPLLVKLTVPSRVVGTGTKGEFEAEERGEMSTSHDCDLCSSSFKYAMALKQHKR
jgi:hypothetical protein